MTGRLDATTLAIVPSNCSYQSACLVLSEGLRPSDSPTRSLARRFAGALRSRGSLAVARSGCRYLLTEAIWVYEIASRLVVQQQNLIDGVDFVFRQIDACGCHVLDEVGDFGGSRNWQNDWGSREQPCQRDL